MPTSTVLGTATGSYATSRATAALTPTANAIMGAFIMLNNDTGTVSNVASSHGTWSAVQPARASTNCAFALWACKAGATPPSAVVTATHSSTGSRLVVFEFDPAVCGGADVASAIIQSNYATGYASGGSPYSLGVSLSAFGSASNITAIICGVVDGQATTFAEQGSLVQDGELATPTYQYHLATQVGSNTSPNVTSTQSYGDWGSIAMEVAAVGGGGGLAIPIVMHHRRMMGSS